VAAADVEKFRLVLDMCEAGIRMYRQRMRREYPLALDEEIEAKVRLGSAAQAVRWATVCSCDHAGSR
jgi:hypothetical protein